MSKYEGLKKVIFSLLSLCFAAMLTIPAHSAPSAVNAVKVSDRNGNVKIVVDANNAVSNYVYRQTAPSDAVVVELFPADLSSAAAISRSIDTGLVKNVKVVKASDKADTVRVVVNVVSQPKFTLTSSSSKKSVTLEVANRMDSPAVAASKGKAVNNAKTVSYKTKSAVKAPAKKVAKKSKRAYAPPVKLVNMDLVNADLVYVLKILAKELDMNIVTDPSVQGSVTMTLKNVPAMGALNLVTKISGFDYKRVGNTIIVGDPKLLEKISPNIMEMRKGNEITQAIPLEHAKASDVMGIVSSSYVDAKVQADPRGTALIVTADPSSMKAIRAFVSQLDYDVPAPVPPRTEIIALKGAKAEELMPIVQKLIPSLAYDVDRRLNALLVTGDEANISLLKDHLDQLDAHLKQVSVDFKVVDLSENGSKNIGVAWKSGDTSDLLNLDLEETSSNYNPGDEVKDSEVSYPMPIGYFTRSAIKLNVAINAMITAGEAKVIASPTLTAKSGEKSEVHIGERYPVVYYDPRAGQYQVQYTDIGTNVVMVATVLPDGYINMALEPSISTFLGLVNEQYPRTAQRDVKINVRVKDGDTMVLAGLLREEESFTKRRIPLLGDIPIIGALFRSETSNKSKNEVVIMVTPHILPD